MDYQERIKRLEGLAATVFSTLKSTHMPSYTDDVEFQKLYDEVDSALFRKWMVECLDLVRETLGTGSIYYNELMKINEAGDFRLHGDFEQAYEIFRSAAESIAHGGPGKVEPPAVDLVLNLIKRFPVAIRPLQDRRRGKRPFEISDEYDLQDLFHAFLLANFKDVRAEERTPGYAGSSSIIDFYIGDMGIAVETKYIRDEAHSKAVGGELAKDIEYFVAQPNIEVLICFVYDPGFQIKNRMVFEKDISGSRKKDDRELKVIVKVMPA